MKIFGDSGSGNYHKNKPLTALLEIQHEWIRAEILAGGTQTPEFLNKNPNGDIPAVESAVGHCSFESNAIIDFLAPGSSLALTILTNTRKFNNGSFLSDTVMSHLSPFAHRLGEVHCEVFGITR